MRHSRGHSHKHGGPPQLPSPRQHPGALASCWPHLQFSPETTQPPTSHQNRSSRVQRERPGPCTLHRFPCSPDKARTPHVGLQEPYPCTATRPTTLCPAHTPLDTRLRSPLALTQLPLPSSGLSPTPIGPQHPLPKHSAQAQPRRCRTRHSLVSLARV